MLQAMLTLRLFLTILRRRHAAVVLGLLAAAFSAMPAAAIPTAFTSRYSTNDTGDVFIFANTLRSCVAGSNPCDASLAGGAFHNQSSGTMVTVDADAAALGTTNSSQAVVTVPAGATVLFAGLYWGSTDSTTPANRNRVKLLAPGDASYRSLTGTLIDSSGNTAASMYTSFLDITSIVAGASSGTYSVGDIQLGPTGLNDAAGWSIVLVVKDPNEPLRNLSVFDGLNLVNAGNPTVTIPVSGFQTPLAGPVRTRLGFVVLEGDRGIAGDTAYLDVQDAAHQITDALHPTTDLFNSTISRLGTRINAKTPDLVNQLGWDAAIIDASGKLTNNQTSTNIILRSTGDAYYPTAVTFATELYAPRFDLPGGGVTKSAVDVNGGTLQPGDEIEYTMSFTNSGQDDAVNVVINDSIPSYTTYKPNSLVVVTGANAGPKSDAANADQAEFLTSPNRVVFRIGTGAGGFGGSGGTIVANGGTSSVRFSTIVDAVVANGSIVSNSADFTFQGATLGNSYSQSTPNASLAIVSAPVVTSTKAVALQNDADLDGVPSPGDTLRYTAVVRNDGSDNASGVTFTDIPDANTALVNGSVTTTQGSITSGNAGTPPVGVNLGTIAGAGASATIRFDVRISSPLPAGTNTVSNRGTISGSNFANVLTDDPATAPADATTTSVTASPRLVVTKQDTLRVDADSNGAPSPGDTIRYTMVVRNTGNQNASNVQLDDIPDANGPLLVGTVTRTQGTIVTGNTAGDTTVRADIGTIAAGTQESVTFDVRVASPLPAGVARIANQAQVTSSNHPAVLSDDPDSLAGADATETPITSSPVLVATKSVSLVVDADGNAVPSPGDTLGYLVTIRNTGNGAATTVRLNDIPDANTTLVSGSVATSQGFIYSGNGGTPPVQIDVGTLLGGATATASFRVVVATPAPAGVTTVANQASVSSDQLPDVLSDDPASAPFGDPTLTTLTASPRMVVEKTDSLFVDADGDGVASPGDRLLYTITVQNLGNASASASVLNDVTDANLSLVVGSVATSQGSVTTGNTAGNTNVRVTLGTVAGGGGSATVSYRVLIRTPIGVGVSQVTDQASVSGTNFPATSSDDPRTAAAGDRTVTGLSARPVVTTTKRATLAIDVNGDGDGDPGDTLLYTVEVTNAGNQTAGDPEIVDTPDANTSLIVGSVMTTQGVVVDGNTAGNTSVRVLFGGLAGAGSRATVSFRVQIAGSLPAGVNQVENQAIVSGSNFPSQVSDDPSTLPGSDPTVTTVQATPVLSTTKRDSLLLDVNGDGDVNPGDRISYQITVRNTGNQTASGLSFVDVPDPNTTLIVGSVITSQGSVGTGNTAGDTQVALSLGSLASGQSASISFTVEVASPLAAGVSIVRNQGTVRASNHPSVSTDDPDTLASSDDTATVVRARPILDATKSVILLNDADASGTPSPGDVLLYTITATNSGNQAATGIVVDDIPDPNTVLVNGSVASSQGSVIVGNTPGDPSVRVNLGALAGGSTSATISFRVRVANPLPAGVTQARNQAQVASNELATVLTDDPSTAATGDPTDTPLTSTADIVVDKRVTLISDNDGDGLPSPGDQLGWSMNVTNRGNAAATGVALSDAVPSNTTIVAGTAATSLGLIMSGSGAGDTLVRADIGSLPGGGTTALVSFETLVVSPLPAGVSNVCNRATVTSDQLPSVLSIDSASGGASQPTCIALTSRPVLDVTKQAVLAVDNGDGVPSPGDTLRYVVTVRNSGNGAATAVGFADTPDANTALVVGSVARTPAAGSIDQGNGAGDTRVALSGITIPGGGAVVQISFDVTIDNPLPANVLNVSNQGLASSAEVPPVSTDDPSTAGAADPTVTPVTASPRLLATKVDSLAVDVNGDGIPNPGDTILYTLTVTNNGNQAATGVMVTDTTDPNASIVAGSVQTNRGTVVDGNDPGDSSFLVNVGTLPGGGATARVTVRVTIPNPLPAGVDRLANQASVSSNELPTIPTDDPATGAPDDPTRTNIAAAPELALTKRDTLVDDADSSGGASPGDEILYTIRVTNTGNQAATTVVISDTPDPNAPLVVGSVQTTTGTITTGNTAGDTSASVAIGTIPGGGASETVSLRVRIPLPFTAAATQISNQARATSAELPPVRSDDPATGAADDPTRTPITAAPALTLTKRDQLIVDADANGIPSPGDTLLYTVIARNNGNQTTTGVVVTDIPDSVTGLVVGTVQTDLGSVVTGNTAGDTQVRVNVGNLPGAGAAATVSFRVSVPAPLPAGVTRASNQAIASSDQVPPLLSDDPTTPTSDDPTVTPLTSAPILESAKRATLELDADSDGVPSPGDTLRYTIDITNTGNRGASGVVMTDTPDANAPLVAGSVSTTRGTITLGNTAGNTSVSVNIGSLAGGNATIRVSFLVRVVRPLPAGVLGVNNQAQVASNELPPVLSDDPSSAPAGDPTAVALTARPTIALTKRAILIVDADNDGGVSPGDTLLYEINVRNDGNQGATAIVVTDTPDPNAPLVVGSTQTTRGTIASGNTVGDAIVRVNVGALDGGGANETISFRAQIADPMPMGVQRVANQAFAASAELPTVASDDPTTLTADDPTESVVIAAPALSASKIATLEVDADGNGSPSPGDTLRYTITVTNTGNRSGSVVLVSDVPDPNAPLVPGSVQTTAGTITSGNGASDTTVAVDTGTIPGRGGSVTTSFLARIVRPLPAGVTSVANQAIVRSTELPPIVTDNPSTPQPGDPTVTGVTAAPALSSAKSAVLAIDVAGDGVASPGDTIEYTIVTINGGNQSATGVRIDDAPDANTGLVVGSVRTDLGTVQTGNTAGDTSVGVNIGALPGAGGRAEVTFRVQVDGPSLPSGVTSVANQALVSSNQLPGLLTDDPATAAGDDPTVMGVVAAPRLSASKSMVLSVDADSDGVPSPGDTLRYLIAVTNNGNQESTAVVVTDTPDANAPLLATTVQTDRGSIVSGNTAGERSVRVDVGPLPGGGATANVSFLVRVTRPLPAGVTGVANQARVTSAELPPLLTDDPSTPAAGDPTVTALTAAPRIAVSKTATIAVDQNGDGLASPGDTLFYVVSTTNTGNQTATGVVLTDTPGPHQTIVAGSVLTDLGSITQGNGPGDATVSANIGSLPGDGAAARVSFRVTVDNPLPGGVRDLANQASVRSDQTPTVPSDDPSTGPTGDPTLTQVLAGPRLAAEKRARLLVDADSNGATSPGDTIEYTLAVTNSGNQAATGLVVRDTPDVNAPLIVGSVLTSAGTIGLGNGAGDTSVRVDVGDLPGGGARVDVVFHVRVTSPLGAGIDRVRNQGAVTATNAPIVATDDPMTADPADPTVTTVTSNPLLRVSKRAQLTADADGDGLPSPGDTLTYSIDVQNVGNGAATGVVLTDAPDTLSALVAGSVRTTLGTVDTGNAAGDPTVSVSLGTIPGGGALATVSFDVQIANPLPAGTTVVANQASVRGDNVPSQVSDDPTTASQDDSTITTVTASARLTVSKRVSLLVDADGNGRPSPGDTLGYAITVANRGNIGATAVRVDDTPDVNAPLVVGTVRTDLGSVTSGNAAGDGSAGVSIGGLAGGSDATVSFEVRVTSSLPAGVDRISNQATAAATGIGPVPSDDPTGPAPDEPTVTAVAATPILVVTKTATLAVDADRDGRVGAGDTIGYILHVSNVGNQTANAVSFSDTPDPNTVVVDGSVRTSLGTITSGGPVVTVAVGDLAGLGGSADVSFLVRVANPMPAGVSTITNQAAVAAANHPQVRSDDPMSSISGDPTLTQLAPAPAPAPSTPGATPPTPPKPKTPDATPPKSTPRPTPKPKLVIDKNAGTISRTGRTVPIVFTVKNASKVKALKVTVIGCAPPGTRIGGQSQFARLRNGRPEWYLGDIKPGRSKTVVEKLVINRNYGGKLICEVVARSKNGGRVKIRFVLNVAPARVAVSPAVTG